MSRLEALIRQFHLDWMIDSFSPSSLALPALEKALDATNITVEALEEQLDSNPHRVEAFLQALSTTVNPEMLLMAWRAICGARIASVHLEFKYRAEFTLVVTLEDESGKSAQYSTTDISDAGLLRHFGIAKLDSDPIYDGFYPIHLQD